jgi:pre-rRNA-processing protein TSR3
MKRAIIVKDLRRISRGAVVLNPVSETAFSPADYERVHKSGLAALDCSWKQAEEVFRRSRGSNHRSLPYLIAANPINTYKPIKLSTAEAIAASLYILGDIDAAEDLLSVFKWGHSFITLNKEWLDSYASCANSSEIVKVQTEIMREHQKLDKNE